MKQIIRVFADTNSIDDSKEFLRLRMRLFNALTVNFGSRAIEGDGFIELKNATKDDIYVIKNTSIEVGMGYKLVVEKHYTKSELMRARFVRLSIEGEPIDLDQNGNPLNEYPEILCTKCSMPNEFKIPVPFTISHDAFIESKSNYWGEGKPSPDREIFFAVCGIIIVVRKLKSILQNIVGDELICVPTKLSTDVKMKAKEFWAIKPKYFFGAQERRKKLKLCNHCDRPIEARFIEEQDPFKKDTIYLKNQQLQDIEIVGSEDWFGNREESPFGFMRDTFISGRLYTLLTEVGVKGLCPPIEPVYVGDKLPMYSIKESNIWIESKRKKLH